MRSPGLSDRHVGLQRHGESPQQQGRPVHKAKLLRKVRHAVQVVKLLVPAVIQVPGLEAAEHETSELREERGRVVRGFDPEAAKVPGDFEVGLVVCDREEQLGYVDLLPGLETFALAVVNEPYLWPVSVFRGTEDDIFTESCR